MKNALTIYGLDDDVTKRIRQLADQESISLSRAALAFLRRGAGLDSRRAETGVVGSSLDHLIGTRTHEDALEMGRAPCELSHLDVIVHTFVFDEGCLLLLRRANTGFLDGYYTLPGGHVEAGEKVATASVREVAEESGIEVLETAPVAVMPYGRGVNFLFEAERWRGTAVIGEPDRCDDLRWVSPHRLPDKTAPYLRKALELRRTGVWYHQFRLR